MQGIWYVAPAKGVMTHMLKNTGLENGRQDTDLPEVEGKVQSERCHLGRRALHVKK